MHSNDEIEKMIHEMLLDDNDCLSSGLLGEILRADEVRDRQISETLEDLLKEVDELIQLAEQIEEKNHL